ncbi:MAG TPA: TrmH family RNA methyltransferase [Candidatus Paceibacterota bacterium]|jgi:tRNA G18 (ribose-2'-O)-methylase SpoU|nr:TrmH family RNA methyltransferase [Candidatus Paceibacterota bacterium]
MIPENKQKRRETYVLLDNIRSVHNVGSIFRTAETLGISKIYCIGTTPTPHDRFGNKRSDFAKVALGAEEHIPWELVDDGVALVNKLKKAGAKIVALEQSPQSLDYKQISLASSSKNKVVIILGNEVEGVSKPLLDLVDVIAEIPLQGKKESLNVSVSAGIFLYRLLDSN